MRSSSRLFFIALLITSGCGAMPSPSPMLTSPPPPRAEPVGAAPITTNEPATFFSVGLAAARPAVAPPLTLSALDDVGARGVGDAGSEAPAHALATDVGACTSHGPMALDRDDPVVPWRVALTFDDGPYADRTPVVLDALQERHQVATFFVLGRHITRKTYALLQRMAADGHAIGSHSYDHDIAMATRFPNMDAVSYIRAQHEVTRMLIDLALLATSADDFEALHQRVFASPSSRRLTTRELRGGLPGFMDRHLAVLEARNGGRHPSDVRYARPPGGGPYLGHQAAPRARYDAALLELSMVNVMWHYQSGDVDGKRARDRGFLVHNLARAAAHGGVILLHDFIRPDALHQALDNMRESGTQAVSLDELLREKYPCVGSVPNHAAVNRAPLHATGWRSSPAR